MAIYLRSDLFATWPLARPRITADEERPEQARVAVLSHRLWRTRFGADPDVIGQRLVLNATPHTVVGVVVDLSVPFEPDLWVARRSAGS